MVSRFVCAVVVVIAGSSPLHGQDGADLASQVRSVGTATRSVAPDLAVVTLEFSAEGASPSEAGRRIAARGDSIRRAIQAIGVPRDSLISGNSWYWGRGRIEKTFANRTITVPNGPPGAVWNKQDTVYKANDVIQARVRDLARLGAIVDTALAYGIIQIPNLTYSATNTTATRLEVLRLATQDAQAQAKAMAEASGGRLGRLLSVSTQDDGRGTMMENLLSVRGSVDQTGTQIVRPQVAVSVTVYARWELVSPQ
jgi:uncharacterized protein YggE